MSTSAEEVVTEESLAQTLIEPAEHTLDERFSVYQNAPE